MGPVAEPADWYVGRTAIVTGAGSGIGAALSRALVYAGAHVVCADLDLDAASDRSPLVRRAGLGAGGGARRHRRGRRRRRWSTSVAAEPARWT